MRTPLTTRIEPKAVRTACGTAAMMLVAPLIGLVYIVIAPFVAVAVLGGLAVKALVRRAAPLRDIVLFLAAPFIGLAYLLLLPVVGLATLAALEVRKLRAAAA